MLIALDYDKTYTADSVFWNMFIALAEKYHHKVICITMRHNSKEEKINWNIETHYTGRMAKKKWAEENRIFVDIWIDDKPAWLFENAL